MTCVRFTGYDLSPPNAPGTPLFDAGKDTHFCPTPGTCRPFFQKNGPPPRATGSCARRQTRNFAYLCKPHKILCMPDFLDDLNDSQRAAVTYCDGPSLVIAGAGSGKTRVLTYKIAYLLEQGMAPWNILALTFTNKAAREMKERIARLVGPKRAQMLWMGTFHSVFARILRRESAAVGFSPRFTIYDQNDSRNLVKTLAKEMQLDEKLYKPALIAGRISAAKNRLLTAAQYGADGSIARRDEMDGVPATAELYARYERRCHRADAMDFDDLLLLTYQLFRDHPDVCRRYSEQFGYLLVDEYQDTNYAQHRIVCQLAGADARICVVGDDAQSIYGFRGAEIGNILQFNVQYPTARLFKLECNYRSTRTIVSAANSVIDHNKAQIKKQVYSNRDEGDRLTVMASVSDKEESLKVAKAIKGLQRRGVAPDEIAVLYRTNAQSRVFEEALRQQAVPYRIYGGLSFYQRKEVKDTMAYFRLTVNPYDEEALRRVINYPARGIGATTMQKLMAHAEETDTALWDLIAEPEQLDAVLAASARTKVKAFADLIKGFAEAAERESAYDLCLRIVKESGIHADVYADRSPENLSRQENLQELANSIKAYEEEQLEENGTERVPLADYLSQVSLLTDADQRDDDTPRVTLMTVHAAKGLEFEAVFITGLEADLFPGPTARYYPKEMEEERRLFYVALTRAKSYCYLSYARSRMRYGTFETCQPSPFLDEIDPACLCYEEEPSYFGGMRPSAPHGSFSSLHTPPSPRPAVAAPRGRLQRLATPHTDAPEAALTEGGGLRVGQHIEHERFGRGEVCRIERAGETFKAIVNFQNAGEKALLLKFARFRKLD